MRGGWQLAREPESVVKSNLHDFGCAFTTSGTMSFALSIQNCIHIALIRTITRKSAVFGSKEKTATCLMNLAYTSTLKELDCTRLAYGIGTETCSVIH